MKKILLGLLLLSSALSFGATQRISLEQLETNESKDILYLAGTKTPYSGEAEIRYPSGQLLSVATFKRALKSALPSSEAGVPTAINITSEFFTASSVSVVKEILLAF